MIRRSYIRPRHVAVVALVAALSPFTLDAQASAPSRTVTREAAGTVDSTLNTRGSSAAPTMNIEREIFSYRGSGRRDPYASLMASGELRPLVSDLRLTSVAYGANGGNSVAILRDVATQQQYRVRVGQTLGRLRVVGIRQKAVIFSIDEFGFSRQETLPLTSDSTTARTR